MIGERKKLLFIQTEQGLFSDDRQRKVVVGKKQRIPEHKQIHDRDVLGQDQSVGAGDLDLRLLERTDYSLEHRAALANQDQHIARQRAICDPAFHGARDFCGEFDRWAGLAGGVERRVPAFLAAILFVGADQIPNFHFAGHAHRAKPDGPSRSDQRSILEMPRAV